MLQIYVQLVFLFLNSVAFAYEGPRPLKNISISTSVGIRGNGIIDYSYKISNPSENDGEVAEIDILLSQDKLGDTVLSAEGLTQCTSDFGVSLDDVNKKFLVPPVGSTAPDQWTCGYGLQMGQTSASYGWGSGSRSKIGPGQSQDGLILSSRGIPAIRDVIVRPYINKKKLPEEYYEDLEKITALENKVKWTGKVLAPRAPPKIFNEELAVSKLVDAITEAQKLNWIKNAGLARSFEAKLEAASKKLTSGDKKVAQNILGALQSEIEAQKGKQLTSEGYALLYYNLDYILKQLAAVSASKNK